MYQSRNAQEFKNDEAILLDLTSKYLKKRITLIPFLEGEFEELFLKKNLRESFKSFFAQKSEASEAPTYHLLYCNKAFHHNFFVSIFHK